MATDLTKIATCCFCGSRTVLRLDSAMHELTCRSCGAALHNMKPLKAKTSDRSRDRVPRKVPDEIKYGSSLGRPASRPKKTRKAKKRRKVFGDLVEDIFEEVFDIFD